MEESGIIKLRGDGAATRAYTYVSGLVDGIYMLMHSNLIIHHPFSTFHEEP